MPQEHLEERINPNYPNRITGAVHGDKGLEGKENDP